MIDFHKELINALKTVLPNDVHYERKLNSGTKTPCISYQETNNYADAEGDTIGYSRISYTVKVWGTDKKELKKYILMVDAVLRPLGFKRNSKNCKWRYYSTNKCWNRSCRSRHNNSKI